MFGFEMEGEFVGIKFEQVYDQVLKSELLQDPTFEHDDVSRQWTQRMLEYDVPQWKLHRGMCVLEALSSLKQEDPLSDPDFFLSSVLGWCIQWPVSCGTLFPNRSHTRCALPTWFKLPYVAMSGVNDGVLRWTHINRILKNHFREQPYYVHLLELFSEIQFQTASGQMIDLLSTSQDLSTFTPHLYRRICLFKTAYAAFYLPFACALLMFGEKLDDYEEVKEILLEMGIYFHVQNDYINCFGDPEETGKVGTDIEDHKCTWLVVKALELCNEKQKKVLHEKYGKAEAENVAMVKSVYKELDMEGVFDEYENEVDEKLGERIEEVRSEEVKSVLKRYLGKIYKRRK